MKILILGSSGMVGHIMMEKLCSSGHDVKGISRQRKIDSRTELIDLTKQFDLLYFLKDKQFDIIINCSAILVDESEKNKDIATYINSYIPHFLEAKYKKTNTKIIHLSTAGIFSGSKGDYAEEDNHDASTFYGRSKSLGEINNQKDLTIRGDFFGPDMSENAGGIFNWLLLESGEIYGYDSMYFNGITTLELAKFVDYLINNNLNGIYNIGANIKISKGELLRKIKNKFNLEDINISSTNQTSGDFSLINIRKDYSYSWKNYDLMIDELKCWMKTMNHLYKHYKLKI
jgi:dTDP-4-dehydrorhamnose reductase